MTVPSLPHRVSRTAENGHPSLRRRWRLLGFAILTPLLAFLAVGCGHAPPAPAKKPIEVVVTTPITDEVTDYQDFTGRLDALKTVDIRARVSGYVTEAPFKEGDLVHEGDLLFQIDPRPYQADLSQAEANLKLAEAERNLQEKIAARAQQLFRSNSHRPARTTKQTWPPGKRPRPPSGRWKPCGTWTSSTWTTPRSPPLSAGRISRRNVDPGNLVTADNTILTTIVTRRPAVRLLRRGRADLPRPRWGRPRRGRASLVLETCNSRC